MQNNLIKMHVNNTYVLFSKTKKLAIIVSFTDISFDVVNSVFHEVDEVHEVMIIIRSRYSFLYTTWCDAKIISSNLYNK